jgi:cbb3-type cytochrome oxidase subunit 3
MFTIILVTAVVVLVCGTLWYSQSKRKQRDEERRECQWEEHE